MTDHTPTPWAIVANDASNYGSEIHSSSKVKAKRVVCRLGGPDREANAAFIVRAVNAHDDLVEALRLMLAAWDSLPPGSHGPRKVANWLNGDQWIAAVEKARTALASAPLSHEGDGGVL